MPLNSEQLLDLDARDTGYEEQLFVERVGTERWMILREPTQSQVGGMMLTLAGRKGDASSAVRDFLDSIILAVEDVQERVEEDGAGLHIDDLPDEEASKLLEAGQIVDVNFLLERLADPSYSFNEASLTEFVKELIRRRSGFPTKPSSGSTSTPRTTGSNSRAGSRRAASSRSGSGPATSRA